MLEKYREELKGEQRPLVDFENDMNIRLQREKQESAKSKLRDLRYAYQIMTIMAPKCPHFSKYNEELGYATSYLLSSIIKAEEPKEKKKVSARKKSTAS